MLSSIHSLVNFSLILARFRDHLVALRYLLYANNLLNSRCGLMASVRASHFPSSISLIAMRVLARTLLFHLVSLFSCLVLCALIFSKRFICAMYSLKSSPTWLLIVSLSSSIDALNTSSLYSLASLRINELNTNDPKPIRALVIVFTQYEAVSITANENSAMMKFNTPLSAINPTKRMIYKAKPPLLVFFLVIPAMLFLRVCKLSMF